MLAELIYGPGPEVGLGAAKRRQAESAASITTAPGSRGTGSSSRPYGIGVNNR